MSDSHLAYDTLIQGAKIFNEGKTAVIEDLAVKDGRVVERGKNLDASKADKVINGEDQWLMPGLFDIHTHYDLELEISPGLPESIRHGTTSVVIANCSLGLAFGNQRDGRNDPIVDCFARVENVPKSILRGCADNVDWETPEDYLNHLDTLNLGPNVATLLPHSMLRIDAMGFEESISRDPSEDELTAMKNTLAEAVELGYVGMSTDALPFHYLASAAHCDKTIPTQFAKYYEIKTLTQVLREKEALWQATPPKDSAIDTLKTFMLSSGFFHGKPLKTTVVAALDVFNNWKILKLGRLLSRTLNSKFLRGDFHLQALGAPFKVWSDGAVTPLAEEIPELRRLNETDLEDRESRQKILNDPEYIQTFRDMWLKGKSGFGIARLKRLINMEDYAFNRAMEDMLVDLCPLEHWQGKNFQELFDRVRDIKRGNEVSGLTDEEAALIEKDFFWVSDEADFVLQTLRTFDLELSWSTVTANRDVNTVRELIMDPLLMPGFNDSGAHLNNMAFYDVNLRSLKLAAEGGDADVSYMVKRLSKDAADLFNVEGGSINIGDKADLILVDPEALKNYDGEANVQRLMRDEFQHHQLVNRSEGVVPLVMIGGHIAWKDDAYGKDLGKLQMGRLLRNKNSNVESVELQEQDVA
ncbi:N-acyl-D-amino-acid deacylase family protein [Pseudoteredinibacter isoporae]|uniref:N-acyl-D-aspartate/D-glutamate deacylase n=1 Tax=Pseudoteredinibacter isoporae TaxID=570281 RepID=A0A7X0MVV2_9GAMM|nr:amidohydrolase family protein [Pseudoteredinibacter isoporae]MBB6520234.1 N-acyl-D-aspartate/D-glutamate deacylase [Pseudoteredinibacter isoporae]NHO85806.1 amidohydrolase family protein [Pseudoteredinibacter isoporae]NIB25742.1 amidohydrolase family protein [Pseudoteredinibacter isoporae]